MIGINIDRVRQLAGEVNLAISKLDRIGQMNETEFLSDSDKVDSAKYNLVVAIEGAIDICNHIVAKAGGRAPRDYADCFRILGELEIFEGEFAKQLQKMAKFRNLLVHLYWQVDNKRVYKILKEDIIDLKRYLQAIGKYIGSEL